MLEVGERGEVHVCAWVFQPQIQPQLVSLMRITIASHAQHRRLSTLPLTL